MKKKVIISVIIAVSMVAIIILIFVGKDIYNKISYDNKINEILSDDKEIERKWLINKSDIPYDLNGNNVNKYEIKQTYLCFDPEMRVRDYNNGQSFELTIKNNMSEDGLVRDETNIDITKEQYDNLIKKQEGKTIHKTRYQFLDNGELIAIDIFHDELDGLAYMEIEFKNEEESNKFENPKWVIRDVTGDINYKNGHLARFGIPK